ncbi:trypsin-like [Aphidius gifuensis]|uniref:trypsin-like n=1 Tax=Aphidius gifuensis TaxID=684658 RepID=UPI001CDC975C|nr:trypsin-like [Aphidius gifuensis]
MSVTTPILAIFLAICITLGHGKTPNKISGGELCPPYSNNFVVSLRVEGKHICGGSLIDTHHVLTAASCLVLEKNIIQNNVKVLVGTHELNNPSMGQVYGVDIIVVHQGYDCTNLWADDIAILKLTPPDLKKPNENMPNAEWVAHLPWNGDIQPESVGIISGWGVTDPATQVLETYLRRAEVSVITNEECNRAYGAIGLGQFCAVNRLTGHTILAGDSGGPLVAKDCDVLLYGIQSWGSNTSPGVFTKVHHYLQWISDTLARY